MPFGSQIATMAGLYGGAPSTGRIPVSMPPMGRRPIGTQPPARPVMPGGPPPSGPPVGGPPISAVPISGPGNGVPPGAPPGATPGTIPPPTDGSPSGRVETPPPPPEIQSLLKGGYSPQAAMSLAQYALAGHPMAKRIMGLQGEDTGK